MHGCGIVIPIAMNVYIMLTGHLLDIREYDNFPYKGIISHIYHQ